MGIILKCIAGKYTVFLDGKTVEAVARGKFRNGDITPVTGDRVKTETDANGTVSITEVYQRKNVLVRPPVANVDTLIITLAVKKPNPDLKLADQLICRCRSLDIEPIICINKADLGEKEADTMKSQFEKSGIRVFITSSADVKSVEELKNGIKDGIACFCGQSAVGKSSLTNAILGREAFLTGGLSKKTERGKHTTRHTELIPFAENKWFADTPGFSLLEIPVWSPEEFKALYTEYGLYENRCRFSGCNHVKEPDCAVKKAVEEGKLSRERYERYVETFAEVCEKWRRRYD